MFANAKQHLPSVNGNYLGHNDHSLHNFHNFCISALLPPISISIKKKNTAILRQMQHSPKVN